MKIIIVNKGYYKGYLILENFEKSERVIGITKLFRNGHRLEK